MDKLGKKNINTQIDKEIDCYFHEDTVPQGTNIIQWWSTNKDRFPILASTARRYIAIPATQASSERLFSTVGNIVTPNRTRLLSGNVESGVYT